MPIYRARPSQYATKDRPQTGEGSHSPIFRPLWAKLTVQPWLSRYHPPHSFLSENPTDFPSLNELRYLVWCSIATIRQLVACGLNISVTAKRTGSARLICCCSDDTAVRCARSTPFTFPFEQHNILVGSQVTRTAVCAHQRDSSQHITLVSRPLARILWTP